MLISGIFKDNGIPELPTASNGQAGFCIIAKEKREVMTLDDEVEQHGSFLGSNLSCNDTPSSGGILGRYQKPLSRDSSSKRNFGGGPSKINGEVNEDELLSHPDPTTGLEETSEFSLLFSILVYFPLLNFVGMSGGQ